MGYVQNYISQEEYQVKRERGLHYTGFVIGYGYVTMKSKVLMPPNQSDYNPIWTGIPSMLSHNTIFYEYEEDQSDEAVGLSYAPLLKMITDNIITENSDNTITVNLGFNEFIHISKTANLRIDTRIDSTNSHMHLLKISVEAEDKFGNKISEIREIPVSGLKYVFHFKENTTPSLVSPVSNEYKLGPDWVSYIPLIGSGRDAYEDFQNGRYGWAAFNTIMAISDIFLVKALFVAGGKIAAKTAFKTGVHSWRATRAWLGQTGQAQYRQHVHHWLLHQKQGLGKHAPEWLKNQPWNLMPMKNEGMHYLLHNAKTSIFYKFYHGTPQWFKTGGAYSLDCIENNIR